MIIPMPIFIPSNQSESSGIVYEYPEFVKWFLMVSLGIAIIGTIIMLLSMIIDEFTNHNTDKSVVAGLFICLSGLTLTIMGVIFMAFTAVPVE